MELSVCVVDIPISILCYRFLPSCQDYKLVRVLKTSSTVVVHDSLIKRRKLDLDTESDIQFFDAIHVPDFNRMSLLFLLIRDSQTRILCRPSTDVGPMRLEVLPSTSTWSALHISDDDTLHNETAEVSFSIFSAVHHFSESPNSKSLFIHDAISLVPCHSIFVPMYLSDKSITSFLTDWFQEKMKSAIQKTVLTATTTNKAGFMKTIYNVSRREQIPFHFNFD